MHLGLGNSQKAKRFRKFVTRSSTKFDGTDDFVETGAQPDFIHTGATMSSWVKMGDFSGMQFMGTHNSKRFYYGFNGTNAVMGVQNAHNVDAGADLSSFVAVGQWHHIVMVADNGTATFYLDGVARDTLSYTPNAASNPSDNLYIGARGHGSVGQFMNASIDEFAVFSSALTAREVDALYNNGQPTKIRTNPNLAHWFRMGEGKLDGKRDGDSNLLFDQGPNGGLSSEKVTNGSFSADSDWTKDSSWTIAAGVASDNGTGRMFQSFSHGDKTYKVSFDVTAYTSGTARIQIGQSSNALDATSVGSFSGFITADGANNIYVNNSGLGFVGSIDNLSVKEVQNVGTINGARIQADGGTELVTNGTFDTDVSGWSAAGNGALSYQNGVLRVTTSGGVGSANQVIALSSGATFTLTFDVVAETQSSGTPFFQVTSGLANTGITSTGTQTIVVTASSDNPTLTFSLGGAATNGEYIEIDNVSVKEVTESVPKKTQNLPSAGSAKSLSFDGTDDTASVPFELPTGTWTVSQWIKINDTSASDDIYVWESRDASHTSGNIMHPIKASASTYKNRWWNAGAFRISPTTEYPIGLWQHVVFVKDEGTGTMYVDGEAVGTATGFSTTADNAPNMFIGARYSNEYHRLMEVDELAVWDTVLDGDAIRALYNAGLPTPVTTKTGAYDIYRDNLKAYYKMGDATNPAADGTSNLLFDQTNPGLGPEAITNGDFSVDSDWNPVGDSILTIANGILSSSSSNGNRGPYQNVNTIPANTLLKIEITVLSVTGSGHVRFRGKSSTEGTGSTHLLMALNSPEKTGTYTFFATPTGDVKSFTILLNQPGSFEIDNVSVRAVNGHTGTISGATIQTEAPKQIYALPPVANTKSIILEGDDEFLQTQVDATLATRYYSFWAKATRTTDNPVFDHGDTTVGSFIFNQSSGKPLLYTSAGNWRYWNDTSAQDDGLWHHWTVYFDSADINNSKLWCDGVEQTVQATSAGTPSAYSTGIRIGRGGSVYFEGSIDEFSIHEDLDEEAIRALFNRGRPIDISSGNGAYDQSDKALHWWRMGDATSPAADGTNDIIFQGLEAESDELVTDGGFDDPSAWNATGSAVVSDGIGNFPNSTNSFLIKTAVLSAGNLVRTYKLQFDVLSTNGAALQISGGSSGFNQAALPTASVGTKTVFLTSDGGGLTQLAFHNNAAFVGSIDNVSLKQVRGQYIGPELVLEDADLYNEPSWFAYSTNVATFPNGTAARFTKPTSGGSSAGGRIYFRGGTGNRALTTDLETGCVYKLQFDFLTDDTNARPRYHDGTSYTELSLGSGTKVFYFAYSGDTSTMVNAGNLSADKFVQFSNLSLTKVGGAAVLTNMDSASDIQTDTPY